MSSSRRIVGSAVLAASLAALTGGLAVALVALDTLHAAPAAALPAFGTDPVQRPSTGQPTGIDSLTVGHHDGFDRLVIGFTAGVAGYSVRYVPEVVQDGSGEPVALAGAAFVEVRLEPVSMDVPAPHGTQTPRFAMLRQLSSAGHFEGVATYGVGLASRSGMRVFTLTGPDRLVVDFAIPAAPDTPAASPTPAGAREPASASEATEPAGSAGAAPAADPSGRRQPNGGPPAAFYLAVGAALLLTVVAVYQLSRRLAAR